MKIAVTGGSGLLGCTLCPSLSSNHQVISLGYTRSERSVDLTLQKNVEQAFSEIKPDVIIHSAALANVDLCEEKSDQCYLLNVLTTSHLASWCLKNHNTHLVFISTDMVYDGPGYKKEDQVKPLNSYAWSKLCAEAYVSRCSGTVLRTNFFGPSKNEGKPSFSDWALQSLKNKSQIKLFTDVLFNALSMQTLSMMIERVCEKQAAGIYNLGSKTGMSKRDFVHHLAEGWGLSTENAQDARQEDATLRVRRPKDMRMDVSHFEKTFSVTLPTLEEEIKSLKEKI